MDIHNLRVKIIETESEVKGLKDMSIEAYREAFIRCLVVWRL